MVSLTQCPDVSHEKLRISYRHTISRDACTSKNVVECRTYFCQSGSVFVMILSFKNSIVGCLGEEGYKGGISDPYRYLDGNLHQGCSL